MKKIYTLIFFLIVGSTLSYAQNKATKKADTHFDRLEYIKAADEYQKLLKKGNEDDYVYTRLADSYFIINDTKKAEPFYKRVVDKPGVSAETVYNYAETLKVNGKYEESNKMMEKFAQMNPNDSRAIDFKNNPNYIPKLLEGKAKFTAKLMDDVNSNNSDFGGIRYGNKIYFASAKNTTGKKYKRTEEPFLDIYEGTYANGKVTNIQAVKGDVNTKYTKALLQFLLTGKECILTEMIILKASIKKILKVKTKSNCFMQN